MTSQRRPGVENEFLTTILAGDGDAMLRLMSDAPVLDHQSLGRYVGRTAMLHFLTDALRPLREHHARYTLIRTTATPARFANELMIDMQTSRGPLRLPVAILADRNDAGAISYVRIYHSMWTLTGKHSVRPPILPHDPAAQPADVVATYLNALATADKPAILNLFSANGYIRLPSGKHEYRGPTRLNEFYSNTLASGGIPLQYCTLTDDGVNAVLEYTMNYWGGRAIPLQAGAAAYERSSDGKLAAVRIYNDAIMEEDD